MTLAIVVAAVFVAAVLFVDATVFAIATCIVLVVLLIGVPIAALQMNWPRKGDTHIPEDLDL